MVSPAASAASEPSVSRTSWSESSKLPGVRPVALVTDLVGQVLGERPAEGDVDQLHAAADAEHRHVAFDRAARQRQLRAVALGHGVLGHGMTVGSVGGGVDVIAAGQDQAVDHVEHLVGVVLELGVGRDHQRQAAGPLDRGDVADGQQRGPPVPHTPLGARERGA